MEGVTKILIFISGFSHRLNPFIIHFPYFSLTVSHCYVYNFWCNAISNMFEDVLIDGIYGGLLLLYHVHEVMDTFNLVKGAVILCYMLFFVEYDAIKLFK